jgi:hypothetical protein
MKYSGIFLKTFVSESSQTKQTNNEQLTTVY